MGFSPQQVDAMSLWQFMSAYNGYVQANSSGSNKLTESQKDDLFEWLESMDDGERWLETQTYWWDGARPEPRGKVRFRVG